MIKRLAPILAAVLLLAAACTRTEQPAASAAAPAAAGNTERGRTLASQYGCNVCHAIPAVEGPAGSLGPSLDHFATRPTFSNGTVPTTHENLTKFIIEPASMNPQTSMAAVGVNAQDAGDIAAYLLTLK